MVVWHFWDTAKGVLRGTFIAIQWYLGKQEKSQKPNLTPKSNYRKRDKQNPKLVEERETIKITTEINEIQTKKTITKINETCRDQLDKQGFWKHNRAREWEKRHKNSEKSEAQGTNAAPRGRCWNWIQASFIILSAMNERINRELNYNSCGLQGKITKWSLTVE